MSGLPKRFPDRESIADVRPIAEGVEPGGDLEERFRLAGRVMGRRDLGKLMFLDLVDRSGKIQLLVQRSVLAGVEIALGDLVGVSGRPAKTKRGEPSIAVEELELLGEERAAAPRHVPRHRRPGGPLPAALPRPGHARGDAGGLPRALSARLGASPRISTREGFVEVETPILQPRYGGAFAEPFVTHSNELDQDMYLRIATELYLKRLIVGGLERVYELGKDFRNESVSYKHQPEFTMLEWYEAYADYRDTMEPDRGVPADRRSRDGRHDANVSFRGHEIDFGREWRRVPFVETLEEHELWTRDEEELRARLPSVASTRATTGPGRSSSTTPSRTSSSRS